jgi:Ca2+-binding RTX toxin-like protein
VRMRHLATAVAAAALGFPAGAAAGTVTRTDAAITYQDTASGSDSVSATVEGSEVSVYNEAGTSPSNGCNQGPDAATVVCATAPSIIFNMLGFDDTVDATKIPAGIAVRANGQGGTDYLYGGAGSDTLDGGAGDDYLIDGLGDDSVSGGPNNDLITPGPGRDGYSGGDGQDTIDYSARTAPVTVTVDGAADDGELGEGDNVATDVENVTGGSGNDRIVGGPAASYLFGGAGNDSISAGAGEQRVEGNEGDDTIDTRDGAFDSIDCGGGTDTLYADPNDSATGCEIAPDRDGDGTVNEQDCEPDNAAVHPGASEIYGNGSDEDCAGGPAYFKVEATITYKTALKKRPARARWTKLALANLKAGDKVAVKCKTKRKGCPFKTKTRTAGASTMNLVGVLKKRYLRVGAVVDVSVARPLYHAKFFRLRVGRGGNVKLTQLCVLVGKTSPETCPAVG